MKSKICHPTGSEPARNSKRIADPIDNSKDLSRPFCYQAASSGKPPSPMRRLVQLFARILCSSATRLKIASFALIGVGNTMVDLGVFTLAYKLFELPIVAANIIAWLVAVSGSYIMNTFITFHVETGRVLRFKHYASFIASGALGMIATTTALVVLSLYVHVMAAKLASILVGFAVNFTMSNLVVFRAPKPKT